MAKAKAKVRYIDIGSDYKAEFEDVDGKVRVIEKSRVTIDSRKALRRDPDGLLVFGAAGKTGKPGPKPERKIAVIVDKPDTGVGR